MTGSHEAEPAQTPLAIQASEPADLDLTNAVAFVDELLAERRISTPEHRLLREALRSGPAAPTDSEEAQP